MNSKYTTLHEHDIQYIYSTLEKIIITLFYSQCFNLHNDSKQNISTIHAMDLFHLGIIIKL